MNSELLSQLGQLERTQVGYRWVHGFYGEPTRPFEPHDALDGAEGDSPEADIFLNADPFPDGDYFAPGDHEGCLCELIEVVLGE